jgi:hypothetical protein
MGCPALPGQSASVKATNGHCYALFPGPLSWFDAWNACVEKGAHLVTFDTKEEADEVEASLNPTTNTWIGAYCKDGIDCTNRARWYWLGEVPISFDDWAGANIPDFPTERCLRIRQNGGGHGFDNQVCSNGYAFLCEIGD